MLYWFPVLVRPLWSALVLAGIAAAPLLAAPAPALVVTDNPQSDAVCSVKALLGEGLRIAECSQRELQTADLLGASKILSLLTAPTNLSRFNVQALVNAARQGATVVLGLDEYAAWTGARVAETRMPNRSHVQEKLSDPARIQAYGDAWRGYLTGKSKQLDPAMRTLRDELQSEVTEPIPSLEVISPDPALRGFPVGSVVPWCSSGNEYVQQQLELDALPPGARVLARSTVNGRPVILRHDLGPGRVYAIALRLLPEPHRRNWETRGGFNKWIPLSNLFARGVLAGTYWNQKPTYVEYARRLREVAAACPDWKVENLGRCRLGDQEIEKIYSLHLGAAGRPVWVIIGMLHAEDEWVPALGALDLIQYLQQHHTNPPWTDFFQRFSIRVIPLLHPSVYESPRFAPGQPRLQDELTRTVTSQDQVYAAMQLHQGGESIVTGCGTPRAMGRAIGKTVRDLAADRYVLWRDLAWKGQPGRTAPMQPESWVLESSVIGGPVPEWDVYWIQGRTSCYGSYSLESMMQAKALHFLEQPMMGFMPDALSAAPSHHWIHRSVFEAPGYMTLWENDQTVAYCLAFLLTPITPDLERTVTAKPGAAPPSSERSSAWRPDALRAFMRQLTDYVAQHHLRRDDSPMRGKVYEFYHPVTGQQGYGAGWDTMHDGAWFANACILAYRATNERSYLDLVRDWVLPFYLRMLQHSDTLFPERDKAFSDGQLLPPERAAATKGFVPYWWDDGHGVNFDAPAMRLTIPQLLGTRFGFTFTLADTNARDGKLAGYSHGTSHHMALAMFPMLANAWLLTRDSAVASAIHHLRENRRYQMTGDLPFLAIADAAAHDQQPAAYRLAAGYDRLPWPPETPFHAAMIAKRKTPLTPFIDDPAAKYYALMMGRRIGTNAAHWLPRFTYDCLRLHDQWYGSHRRPRGLAIAADSPTKVWVVDGRFDSIAGERPEVLVGSRMGPQTLWACALSLQLLRTYPDAGSASFAPIPGESLEPTRQAIQAQLQEELDEGLRFWQDQLRSVGYLRADWPIGGKKPSAWYWRDQASESGAYAHLIAACAEYLLLLQGQTDWDTAWSIRAPDRETDL